MGRDGWWSNWMVLCLLLVAAVPAWAHKPIFPDGAGCTRDDAIVVEDVTISQVAYTEITDGCPQLWLTFEAEAGQELYLQIALPQIERYADLRPAVAVLGPGLPTVDVPFDVPEGYGGYVFTTDDVTEPESFHEPFTGTDSWILRERTQDLPEAGQYYIVAYVPSGETGKIWVAFGRQEQFGLGDIVSLPGTIATVREFHEVSGTGGLLCPLLGFGGLTVVGAAPVVIARRRRRR